MDSSRPVEFATSRIEPRFRLANGGETPGLECTPEGLTLGGASLLRRAAGALAPRPAEEVRALLRAAYGEGVDPAGLAPGLDVIARALNQGDLGRAMVAALHLRLPDLGPDDVERIAKAEDALAKFDSSEPRDERGRWTSGGGIGSTSAPVRDQARAPDRAGSSDQDQPLLVPVSDKVYPNVTAFRKKHLADAIKLAAVIGHGATADEVLAVSGNESTYGDNYKAKIHGYFFGIHSRGTDREEFLPGQTGVFSTSRGKLMAGFDPRDAFFRSGLIFANRMREGAGNEDVSSPLSFFSMAHSLSWGAGTPDYVRYMLGVHQLFRNSASSSERPA